MRFVFLTILLVACVELVAQRDSIFYFDASFRRQKNLLNVKYKGYVRKYNGKNFEVELFTLEGVKIAYGEYSSRSLKKRNGVFVMYNGEEKVVVSFMYRNGLLHGRFARFYDNGIMADSGTHRFGATTGIWKHWYSNGNLSEVERFSNNNNFRFGIRDREYMSWYTNGQLRDSGLYKQGLRSGIWIEYVEDGNIKSIGEYKKGWKQGLWRYYDTSGKFLYMKRFKRFNYDQEGVLVQIK